MTETGHGKKGQVLVLMVLMLVMLLAFAGLAVDAGMAYVVKTKLAAAVDAAALAAGKVGSQDGTREAEAEKFFLANFPQGLLGASVQGPITSAGYDRKDRAWNVTVSATASVPTYFARVLNWDSFTVGASATSTVQTADLVLVMDASSSLDDALGPLKAAAERFIALFDTSHDRVGLLHFASGVEENITITPATGFNRERVQRAINGIQQGGYTTAEEALRLAKKQFDDIPEDLRSRQRIIVFFADGAPNGAAATFSTGTGSVQGALSSQPATDGILHKLDRRNEVLGTYPTISTLPGVDWTNTVSISGLRSFDPPGVADIAYTNCNLNRAARNMAENIANAARTESGTPITIFTIGLGGYMTRLELECPGYGNSEFGANIMRRLANVPGVDTYNPSQPSGVYAFAADASQLDAAFGQVARAILRLSK